MVGWKFSKIFFAGVCDFHLFGAKTNVEWKWFSLSIVPCMYLYTYLHYEDTSRYEYDQHHFHFNTIQYNA